MCVCVIVGAPSLSLLRGAVTQFGGGSHCGIFLSTDGGHNTITVNTSTGIFPSQYGVADERWMRYKKEKNQNCRGGQKRRIIVLLRPLDRLTHPFECEPHPAHV